MMAIKMKYFSTFSLFNLLYFKRLLGWFNK